MANRPPHPCRKEGELAAMQVQVNKHEKILMGNGKDGLSISVAKLAENVLDLRMTTKNLDRNLDNVLGRQSHYEGEKDGKDEMRKRTRWMIGTTITLGSLLLGALGWLIKLLIAIQHGAI